MGWSDSKNNPYRRILDSPVTADHHVTTSACHQPTRRPWSHLLAGGLIALYIGTFSWLALMRHASFDSEGFDLGVYDQVVWNTLHGRPFFYTSTGQPLLHLSNHASPILLLIAPFYLIHSGPQTLLLLQAATVGLGGLPLYWWAREKMKSDLAGLSLLAAYLLFPALQVVTLSDFHPPALAVGFLMAAFYFLLRRRVWLVVLFSVLAMACKEQIPLTIVMMGLYAIVAQRNWRLGLTLVGMGIVWFVTVMYWVIPAFSVTGGHIFMEYYADLGSTPLEVLATALTKPGLVLSKLWQPANLEYLRDVLIPFAGLPVVGMPALLIGLPAFGINLLSANPAMHDATRGHYSADVAPWLAWGAAFGMYYLTQRRKGAKDGNRDRNRGSPLSLSLSLSLPLSLSLLGVALYWQVWHGYSPLALDAPHWEVSSHDQLAQRFLEQIPPDAAIAAQGELYPHLSDRMIAYHLPSVNDAEYVLVDVASTSYTIHPNDLRALVRRLLAVVPGSGTENGGEFGIQDAADGYMLLRRGLADRTIPDTFYDFARVSSAHPEYPVQIDFQGQLRLLGIDVIDDLRRQETRVRLYWQALRPTEDKLRLYPFFLDPQGQVIEDTRQRPLITQLWYPPRQWRVGEVVIAETLPWAMGTKWSLAVGVLADSDWSDRGQRLRVEAIEVPPDSHLRPRRLEGNTWVRLATFERQGRQLVEVTPPADSTQPDHPLRATLGEGMALLGYDLSPATARRGQTLTVTLQWQAGALMALDYTVFVHMVGADGGRVAQDDAQPWWEVPLPTSSWQPGEVLRDRHVLSLPVDLPPGTYHLQVGAYYWQTGERLPTFVDGTAAGDSITLGTVEVE
jgi:uncharacterized membrane protein